MAQKFRLIRNIQGKQQTVTQPQNAGKALLCKKSFSEQTHTQCIPDTGPDAGMWCIS